MKILLIIFLLLASAVAYNVFKVSNQANQYIERISHEN